MESTYGEVKSNNWIELTQFFPEYLQHNQQTLSLSKQYKCSKYVY